MSSNSVNDVNKTKGANQVKNSLSNVALILAFICGLFLIVGNVVNSSGRWLVVVADVFGAAAIILSIIGIIKKERIIYLPLIIILIIVFAALTAFIKMNAGIE